MPKSCPRCQRALPPASKRLCVYCGAPLVRGATDPGFRPSHATGGDPLIGTVVSGRFRIEDLIGQGGMGKVYRARHLALERTVVLKMLKPQLLEDPTLVGRFEREAKAASRLNHPNVIQVLDFGRLENDGTLYIVMEHVQGKDLRLVLRDEWPLAEERLCNIMAQVCSALAEAHVNDIIHRDLKPENVMVEARRDQPDHVKVLDVGIAKILGPDVPALARHGIVRMVDSEPGLTRHDVVCGTPQYMAPEQATGTALDERCDLYAVGVILYQMTTGHLPFDGPSSMEVLTRHVNEAPVPPRQRQPDAPISEAMERLILRALQKNPAMRPQTAEQFRDELLAVPEQARSAARAATPPRNSTPIHATPAAPPPSRRGNRILWMAAVATGVLAVLGVVAAVRRPLPRSVAATSVISAAQHDAALARTLVAQSRDREQAGNLTAARDLLEAALAADPANAEAHYRLAGLLVAGDSVRARAEYEASRKLDPARYGETVARILEDLK